jgi:5-formyltetrahydrofolate cyclo-ligase
VCTGARGFDSDGTTIVNRSNHMPMFTEIDAMSVPAIVLVRENARIGNGIPKQEIAMVQNSGAK